MNTLTAGAVAEISTPRGLGVAVITEVKSEENTYKGYLVRNNNHQEILGTWDGYLNEIITVIDNERGAVLEYSNGWVMVNAVDNEIIVTGTNCRTTHKKTVSQALDFIITVLNNNEQYGLSKQISGNRDFWLESLTQILAT